MAFPEKNSFGAQNSHLSCGKASAFCTTHWSVVLQAGQGTSPKAKEALEQLCHTYWYPLYVYVRRNGQSPPDAQDLTQQFFARFLERKFIERADPERGRFRSFLLTSLKHFLADDWEKRCAQKRGGGETPISWDEVEFETRYQHEPQDTLSPDRIYEKRWAGILLEGVLDLLRTEYEAVGRGVEFAQLRSFVWGAGNRDSYATIADQMKIQENALKGAVHRLRKRFRDQLRAEVLKTVASPEEVDEELRHLRGLLSS